MNISHKTVSVLIPTYNRKDFLIEAIKSCFEQTHSDIKIIIYDDGSTDGTKNKITKYLKTVPTQKREKVTYVYNTINNGIGYARNILLDNITTDYACWLDSDDLMSSDRIEKSLITLESNNYDILYTNIQHFIETDDCGINKTKVSVIDVNKYIVDDMESITGNTACATAFFRNSLKNIKMFDKLTMESEDVLWLYTLLHLGYKIGHLDEAVYYYRSHGDRLGVIKRLDEHIQAIEEERKLVENYINDINNRK